MWMTFLESSLPNPERSILGWYLLVSYIFLVVSDIAPYPLYEDYFLRKRFGNGDVTAESQRDQIRLIEMNVQMAKTVVGQHLLLTLLIAH